MAATKKDNQYPIRARSHLLTLLGEELIGDDRLAIFELVKNGYDADATEVAITLNLRSQSPSIVVQDSGVGMTLEDITDKWLELATDSRRKNLSRRSAKFQRLPLGEKGVGRIAVFKLGRAVTLTTRAKDNPEYQVTIDWDKLVEQGDYLEDLTVDVRRNLVTKHFPGKATGTRIEIEGLRRTQWARGDLRKLYRLVTSLASPFETPDQFNVTFSVPGREGEIADMMRPDDFLKNAVWNFEFTIDGRVFDWKYHFTPPHWKQLKARSLSKNNDRLTLILVDKGRKGAAGDDNKLLLKADDLEGVGPIAGQVYAYYRRSEILQATGGITQMRMWLDDQTGVRVYRDGVRVFNYGEPNDDWLGLNARRINRPGAKLGTHSIVAAVHLKLAESRALREKTNREGFDQNDAFARLQRIVLSVFEHFELLHGPDRTAIDAVIRGVDGDKPLRFTEAIAHLRDGIESKKLDKEFKQDIDAIEHEFTELRDVMVSAGTAGLNLAVIFHEIEREVDALANAVDRGLESAKVRQQIDQLSQLLHGFAPLLRKNPARLVFVSEIIAAALRIRESRFTFHKVVCSVPLLDKKEKDFRIRGPSNLLIGALGNLLDNALYWTRWRKERDERSAPAAVRVITSWDDDAKSGMIAVVDNGPGFTIPPSEAVKAFRSTRTGGMGLGLYFANLVMEQCGGTLTVHAVSDLRDEVDIPASYDGAAVAMRFGSGG
jgi:signal transduction histidine kinase